MSKAVFRKRGATLLPVDDEGRELLHKLKDGRDVVVEVKVSRNPRHHRLWWQIVHFVRLNAVYENGDSVFDHATERAVATAIKIAIGFGDTFVDLNSGKTIFVPGSTAWEAMDQLEFNKFFETACRVIAGRWMPANTTPEAVRAELLELIDGPHAVNARTA